MPLHLRIVHGRPTPTEVAALTAVLTALACRTPTEGPGARGTPRTPVHRAHWDRGWRAHPAPGSWRARFGLPPRHPHH
ncbi:acyl-CoA carboxylase subunit epsilon [Streptomyces ficellus]|nr:acyl-CoA carboxylase subunit epsilon [Streptomyces ficellus]